MRVICGLMGAARSRVVGAIGTCTILLSSACAWAVPTYVGSFNVYDGPSYATEPQILSAREVAAMLFGGSYARYAISVVDSTDWQTITHTAWVDGYFDDQYLIDPAHEDFVVRPASGLYNDYPAYSAWVCDHAECVDYGFPFSGGLAGLNYTNYVWRLDETIGAAPEPGALALAGLGFIGLGVFSARRRRPL